MSTAAIETARITAEQRQQYKDEGYCILERAIPPDQLQMLRDQCQHFIDVINAEMDAKGVEVEGINHRDSRYFIAGRHRDSAELRSFLFGDLMAEVVRATVGPEAYLFVDQFVVKMAEVGMKFAWHQDSGYVSHPHPEYLSA